jgi:glutamyl-Q tRNA(Asp) synthetase
VRIEDSDTERCLPGVDERILSQLAACGLVPDDTPVWQTQRMARYEEALAALVAAGLAYPCGCTRAEIDEALARQGVVHARHQERVYPGTCRDGLHGKPARAWRFATSQVDAAVTWTDRRLGLQQQNVAREVGDFVLRRADGPWAYQLCVIVDDADQHITDVVRGEDLTDNTARQILLQRALGLPTPRYLHTPLVRAADGEKLSKQHGAAPFDAATPEAVSVELSKAARVLGLAAAALTDTPAEALARWVPEWAALYNPPP